MADPSYVVDGVLTDGDALVCIEETSLASVSGLQWDTGTGTKNWSQYEDLLIIISSANTTAGHIYFSTWGLGGSNYFSYQYVAASGASSSAADGNDTKGVLCWGGTSTPTGCVARIHNINSNATKKCISQMLDNRGSTSGWSTLYCTNFLLDFPINRIDIDYSSGSGSTGSKAWLYGVLPRMGAI